MERQIDHVSNDSNVTGFRLAVRTEDSLRRMIDPEFVARFTADGVEANVRLWHNRAAQVRNLFHAAERGSVEAVATIRKQLFDLGLEIQDTAMPAMGTKPSRTAEVIIYKSLPFHEVLKFAKLDGEKMFGNGTENRAKWYYAHMLVTHMEAMRDAKTPVAFVSRKKEVIKWESMLKGRFHVKISNLSVADLKYAPPVSESTRALRREADLNNEVAEAHAEDIATADEAERLRREYAEIELADVAAADEQHMKQMRRQWAERNDDFEDNFDPYEGERDEMRREFARDTANDGPVQYEEEREPVYTHLLACQIMYWTKWIADRKASGKAVPTDKSVKLKNLRMHYRVENDVNRIIMKTVEADAKQCEHEVHSK